MAKHEQLHPTRDSLSRAIMTYWATQLIPCDGFSFSQYLPNGMRFEIILETRKEHLARKAR
jgi:hypothetical protein